MQAINLHTITTDRLSLPVLAEKNIEAAVLRLDKIHPLISGNKWFKLRYYLEEAKGGAKKTIVTWGGAWSNHLLATAAACALNKISCAGIIRGEAPGRLSPTLTSAKELGMRLVFISRSDYRAKKIPEELTGDDYYFIPEGGYGTKGAAGAATILDFCNKENYTHICCAAGTGTMTAGLVASAPPSTALIAISVLKNNFELEESINHLIRNRSSSFHAIHDYHFGGYAKYTGELIDFMNGFYREEKIHLDFVYTGKLFFGVTDLITRNFFPEESSLLLIHSGGLQGNASLSNGTLIF